MNVVWLGHLSAAHRQTAVALWHPLLSAERLWLYWKLVPKNKLPILFFEWDGISSCSNFG